MANIREVNIAVKKAFPALDIEVVRGDGYIYFDGDDGFDKIDSIYIHPVTADDDTLIDAAIHQIKRSI
tara:strand:- start:975 stop:1178 length:204 start_codon:yes stop_codon:yes gene_type:complete